MTKQAKIVVLICSIILIGAIVAFFLMKKRSVVANEDEVSHEDSGAMDKVLKRGDRGEDVKKLQTFLNERLLCHYIYDKPAPMYGGKQLESLDVDGIFGPRTEAACEWWFDKKSVQLSELK